MSIETLISLGCLFITLANILIVYILALCIKITIDEEVKRYKRKKRTRKARQNG